MKFRRKPVVRDVVDALKGAQDYTVQKGDGSIVVVPAEEFERDYEPAKRDYVRKPKTKRAKKGDAA